MTRDAMAVLSRVLCVLVFVWLLVYFAFYVYHATSAALFPYDLDNGEAYILNQSRMMGEGRLGYLPLEEPPYLVNNYPPLYPALLALPNRFELSFAWGRWLSVLAALGTGLCITLFIHRLSGDTLASGLGGLLYFSSYYVYEWTPFHRVDSLGVFLCTLGLLLSLRTSGAWWAIPCFILALLTRQTYIFAPAAVVLYHFLRHERRLALTVALGTFGGTALVYLALNVLTGGEFFRHIIAYNANEYEFRFLFNFLRHNLIIHRFLLVLGIFYLCWTFGHRRVDLAALFALAALPSVLLSGKVGAASNYMLEHVISLCLMTGLLVAEFRQITDEGSRALRVLFPLLLLFQLLGVWHLPHTRYTWAPSPLLEDRENARDLAFRVRSTRGQVLAEDNGYLVLSGKEITYQPFVMTRLAAEGVWDPAPVLDAIRRQHYSLIVLTFNVNQDPLTDRFSPEMLEVIRAHYAPTDVVPGPAHTLDRDQTWWNYWIYEPRPVP